MQKNLFQYKDIIWGKACVGDQHMLYEASLKFVFILQ